MDTERLRRIAAVSSPWLENPDSFHPDASLPERTLTTLLWQQITSAPIIQRACHKIILGPRRSGKTTLLKHLAKRAVAEQLLQPGKVLYLSLDEDQYEEARLYQILDSAKEVTGATVDSPALLLLDEVVHSPGWDRTLKRCYDEPSQYPFRIVGTASSCSGLTKGMRESIAGRAEDYYLLSAQFSEALRIAQIPVAEMVLEPDIISYFGDLAEMPITESIRHIRHADPRLQDHIWRLSLTGGYPENLNFQAESPEFDSFFADRQARMREIVAKIVREDLRTFARIPQYSKINAMLGKLARNPSMEVNRKEWAQDPSISVTSPTLDKYWTALDESMVAFLLPNKAGQRKAKKGFFYDVFVPIALHPWPLRDLREGTERGWLIENLVASCLNELVHHTYRQASLWHCRDSSKREFDFVFQDHQGDHPLAIETASNYRNKVNKLAHQRALLAKPGFAYLRGNAYVVTPDAPINHEGDIKSVPLAEFLLLVEARKDYLLKERMQSG